MIVAVDVDDVVADTMPAWLRLYNFDYNDHLKPTQIKEFGKMERYVKPECGKAIYRYLERGRFLYDGVQVMPGAVKAVDDMLNAGHRIVFATNVQAQRMYDAKLAWLDMHGFWPDVLCGDLGQDYVAIKDKSLLAADVWIDDRAETVRAVRLMGKRAILFDRPWNRAENYAPRLLAWQDLNPETVSVNGS
jgi:5'(3')-deoxyribonucleotidase